MANTSEVVLRIKVITNARSFWTTNNPIIPLGEAAHASEDDTTLVRIGDGQTAYNDLPVSRIDATVAQHAANHQATGNDPLLATDVKQVYAIVREVAPSTGGGSSTTAMDAILTIVSDTEYNISNADDEIWNTLFTVSEA